MMIHYDTLRNALDSCRFDNACEIDLDKKILPKIAFHFLYGGYILINDKEKLYLREIEFYFMRIDGTIEEEKMYRKESPDNDWLEIGTLFPHNSGIDITFEDSLRHQFRASVLIRAFDLFDMDNNPIILDEGRSLASYDILLSRSNIFDGVSFKWVDEWMVPRAEPITQVRRGLKGSQEYRLWNYKRNENIFTVLDQDVNLVYFSKKLLDMPEILQVYKEICSILDEYGVAHEVLEDTKDIWCRDYMPIQTYPQRFVQYDYEPDYLDCEEYRETKTNPNAASDSIHLVRKKTRLILDGGNIIRTAQGIIMTRKAYNANNMNQKDFERMFYQDFGIKKITWLKWDKSEIYGHSDGIVRYIDNNRVLMTNYAEFDKNIADSFRNSMKHDGYEVEELHFSSYTMPRNDDDLSWAYINYLQTSKVIIVPLLGIEEQDKEALAQIQNMFPKVDVKGVYAVPLLKGEGGFNCFSWTIKGQ